MRLLLFALSFPLWAQNPQTPIYPGAVVGDKDLGVQVNRFQTLLTNPIGTTDTTLTLQSTAGLVAYTYLGIDFEYMMVCAVVNATTVTIGKTSCPNVNGRGLDGTSVAAHLGGKTAAAYLVAGQYNQVAAEVKAVENCAQDAATGGYGPADDQRRHRRAYHDRDGTVADRHCGRAGVDGGCEPAHGTALDHANGHRRGWRR